VALVCAEPEHCRLGKQDKSSSKARKAMNRRVLLIAFHYPPVKGSSGIQRTLKFSAYLREYDWEPMVLSISPRAYEQTSDDQMSEIPEGVIVERAFGLDTSRHLAIGKRYPGLLAQPDRWVSWLPFAVWRGHSMIRRYRPSVIMSTFPIATAHLVGLTLQRLSGLPWIADFRDSMTEPGYPRDALTWRIHRRLEAAIVHRCACAIFTTQGARQMYAARYPEKSASCWSIIENGFDEENFRDAESQIESKPLSQPGQITLLHSGILYPEERDPRPFFAALRTLKESGEISGDRLQVILRATANDHQYRPLLSEAGITDIVKLFPAVAYQDALQEMLRADGLLLFQASNCNHQIPAKLYEYLRAGRPILALTDPLGNTADALRAAGATDIVNIADTKEIVAGLRRLLGALRDGTATGIRREIADLHSRHARSKELAALLQKVTAADANNTLTK
jgi:glycosyltransferase involved in cell wall biosynthesis